MAQQYIFTMIGLNKYYGQKQVLNNINLSFYPGAKIGIVGENGAGKSTVLRIMGGLDEEFKGTAEISSGYKAGVVLQEPILDEKLTVRKTLETAFGAQMAMMAEYEKISESMAEPMDDDEMQKAMDRMGELQDQLDASDAWNLDQKMNLAGDALCLPDDDRIVGTLSGGERRRVALGKALLEQPDLLLLDEPTNHLDAETVDWLEMQLSEYPGTVIIVTHDRYFLDNITKWILELDNGRGIPYEGNYSSWLEQKLARLAAQEKKDSPRARALERELAWIKMSNKDRQNMTRSRLLEYEQLIARENAADRESGDVIQIVPGPELGDKVIEFNGVSKQFGDNLLFKDLSFIVPKSAIVGLVGPNGTGKTTLLKMLVGQEKPDSGEVKIGPTVNTAYVDQGRESLAGSRSLVEDIGDGADEIMFGKRAIPIRQYLARFGFRGADQQKSVDQLSGGERNRAHLAKILKIGGNIILLDEPTNDLDVNTLRMLEEAIMNFRGCALVISHDRFFLNRICTHLLVFEGEGKVRWFEGNYAGNYSKTAATAIGSLSKPDKSYSKTKRRCRNAPPFPQGVFSMIIYSSNCTGMGGILSISS
ncbi:MAG: energy-dependent translational throttle protein EttA [candidate division Zixibacteria bacterium HGW-Zixibacteria-1]|nr:MAG: energy-dependent translational throttle protein EttA [candidate division Zixibacteria bacterium HGW-Zixibacteria-1]